VCVGVSNDPDKWLGVSPVLPRTDPACKKFAYVTGLTFCAGLADQYKISLAEFYRLNPDVGSDCSGLAAKYYVCVGI